MSGVRRIAIVGQKALASPDFLLDDLAGTSGRLDVLLRALRASLLVSHGLRTDTTAYLVLLGGPRAPRTVRVEGATAQYVRPEERSLAVLMQKVLAVPGEGEGFVPVRPGISVANAGLNAVLRDAAAEPVGPAKVYVLEEGAPDLRSAPIDPDALFVIGDHLGFDATTRAALNDAGAVPLGLGPLSVHAEDAVAILSNELDRRR